VVEYALLLIDTVTCFIDKKLPVLTP